MIHKFYTFFGIGYTKFVHILKGGGMIVYHMPHDEPLWVPDHIGGEG